MPSDKRKLTVTQGFRLSPEEVLALRKVADETGLGPSTFARRAVLRAMGQSLGQSHGPRRTLLAREISKRLGMLGRVGSLLNQIARHANSGGGVDVDALREVRQEVERLTLALLELRGSEG